MTHVLQDEFDDPGDVVDPNAVKRDRWDRPLLPPVNLALARAEGDERPFTRCTTFAGSLDEQSNLSLWSQRLVAKGMAEREDLRLLARSATLEDKQTLNEVISAAKELAGGPSASRLGTALHSFTEMRDRGLSDDDIDPEMLPRVDAYSAALAEHGIEIMPDYIERLVCWEKFSVSGTFDRIVMYKGSPVILDLKTGKDLGYGWLKIAVQLLCYAMADGIWDQPAYRWHPLPDGLRTDIGLVVHLPSTGDVSVTVYEVDLLPAVAAAQLCSEVRDWRKTRGLATKLTASLNEVAEEKPLSAQITDKVLAGNEAAKASKECCTFGCTYVAPHTGPCILPKPKRRAPRKKAEPVVETLEFAELDEEVAAAETEIAQTHAVSADPNWPWPWSRPETTTVDVTADSSDAEAVIEADVSLVEEFDDPFAEVVEVDLEIAVTPEEKFAALIRGAVTPSELSQIRKEAIEEEAWTDSLLQLGMDRLAELKK